MEVYIEPINPSQKLLIFGAGHIGKAISLFAKELDFSIYIVDPRENIFTEEMLRDHHCINEDYFKAIDEFPFDENTYSVIVTPKHLFDEEILGKIARKPHAYLGMLGSSRKVEMARQRFLAEKVLTKEELDAVDMPIGIKFRVQTPQEIAVSILAKLIDVRNSRTNSNS
jgi:xanthine dehydrogenase accessory factor